MHVIDRGVVFDTSQRPADQRVAAFVSLCRLRSGAILCGFQNGPEKNSPRGKLRLCRSTDDGGSWRELPCEFEHVIDGSPGSFSTGEIVEVADGELLMCATWFDRSDPERPLFDPDTGGILRSKLLLTRSKNEGEHWSEFRELPTPGLTGCAGTGPLLRWPSGAIAISFESFKEFDDPAPVQPAAWAVVSEDAGVSFSPPRRIARHPRHEVYYWDQRLCTTDEELGFIGLFWTHDLIAKQDRRVHIRRGSLAEDAAETPIRDTKIPGQIAASLLVDKQLFAFVVDRGDPATLRLWRSPDGGSIWADNLVIYEHQERARLSQGTTDVDYEQYWEDMAKWSFGHPAIRQLDDQSLLLAYYAARPIA